MEKRFKLSSVITMAVLFAFVGFGLGFNYPQIQDLVEARLLKRTNKSLPADLEYSGVEEIYDELRKRFAGELSADQLIEGAKRGLAEAAGDPYTSYLSKAEAEELQADLDGTFSGIGAEIAIKNERLVVVAPLSGTPAAKAGLQPGDRIIEINAESTAEMSVETAVSKIRGPQGSEVTLLIVRGNKPAQEFKIRRATIAVPAVNTKMEAGNVGYIEFVRFGDDSLSAFTAAVEGLKAKGAKKLILDLRNNPGGLLSAAVELSDEFLEVGKTIVEERKDGEVLKTFRSTAGGSAVGMEVIVLINEGSASASEIVAGALRDNNVARLVGETSFGKGSVQELVELGGNNYLKVTIARWFTPAGKNISEAGLEPDTRVDLSTDDFNNNRDPQLVKALELLR